MLSFKLQFLLLSCCLNPYAPHPAEVELLTCQLSDRGQLYHAALALCSAEVGASRQGAAAAGDHAHPLLL